MTLHIGHRPDPIDGRNPRPRDTNTVGIFTEAAPLDTTARDARKMTTALIVHWGNSEPTVRLARELELMHGIDEVVVVANDLQERPVELTATTFWIVPERNLGFAGGFDFGRRIRPDADFYLLLNNDLEIGEECVTECLRVLEDSSIGIVAPVLVGPKGLMSAVGRVSGPLFRVNNLNYPGPGRACDADWVSGAMMFVRAACHDQVGLDLSYFLGYEDVDVCFRARRAGWRVVIASRAQARHQGGATIPSAASVYYFGRNRIWLTRRWRPPLQACLVWMWMALVLTPRMVVHCVARHGDTGRIVSALHALVDGLRRLPSGDAVPAHEPYPEKWSAWN